MKTRFGLIIILGLTLVGCASYQEYAAERTVKLREIYPAGMSQEEVQARWGKIKPDFFSITPQQRLECASEQLHCQET
jgi:hypothetical protein